MTSSPVNMVTATWALILVYMAVIIFIVIKGAKKTKSINDYAVGSIMFSPFAVGLALAASMTSAATFIINPGFIAYYGISAYISFGLVLPFAAFFSLVLLTKGFRKHGNAVKAVTMAQWMGTRYNSKGYGLFFAFLSLLLITFIVLITVGVTQVLSKALDVDPLYVLIGIIAFIFGYMMFGGANSMVYTNTVQAIIMLIVAFILLGSGYEHFSSGVTGFLDKLRDIDPKLVAGSNDTSFLFRDFFEIYITQIIIGFAIVCQPHIITKSLLLKHENDTNKYLVFGIITQFIFFSVVFAGLYARISFPDLIAAGAPLKLDQVIPTYVLSEFPVFVGIIVVLGLISAGISTLEGLIQSLSTTTTTDIIKPLFGKHYPVDPEKREKGMILTNKIVIVFLGIVSAYISYGQILNPKLSVAILGQNGVYAYFSAAFVPILFGMFLKDVKKAAPIAASVAAIIVHVSFYYGKIGVPFTKSTGENPGVAASMAFISALVVGTTVYLAQRGKKNG